MGRLDLAYRQIDLIGAIRDIERTAAMAGPDTRPVLLGTPTRGSAFRRT
jgi:hypothetical protein